MNICLMIINFIRRLANTLHLTQISVENMWKVVNRVKLETDFVGQNCSKGGVFAEKIIKSQVEAVEQMLEVESSELRFENMTEENLENAAKMFIHLAMCIGIHSKEWFKSWDLFYKDLFHEKTPPYQIILTLNRMVKLRNVKENAGKLRAKKLFKRIADHLSLKYGAIQSLLPLGAENMINPHILTSIIKSEGKYNVLMI